MSQSGSLRRFYEQNYFYKDNLERRTGA